MGEEEKKAIKMIKEQKEDVEHGIRAMECTPEDYDEDTYNDYVEWNKNANIILNLIEKQDNRLRENKELQLNANVILNLTEQLKKENEELQSEIYDLINETVPKSVIREKTEELEKQRDNIKIFKNIDEYDRCIGKIEVLIELLGDEK